MNKVQENKTVIFDVTYEGHFGDGYKHLVLRRIEMLENHALVDLHNAIQKAIGWTDPHLYSFFMDNKAWKNEDMEYTSPYADRDTLELAGQNPNIATVTIRKLALKPRQKFLYVFDFGEDHHFKIKVVGFDTAKNLEYPRLIHSEGRAPKQYPSMRIPKAKKKR
ncbi:MAG: hypothetical protein HY832_02830 [Candidatus Aenigmarchaeota archaeon]|nr:hypothetical protein [Candidatus Aenigmarchaeota archaeon]